MKRADDDVRYDDMIRTVLDQPLATVGAQVAAWAQIVDLIAQGRGGPDTARAYAFLRGVRDEVSVATRARIARQLGGRSIPAVLLAFFAEDSPFVATPLMATAVPTEGDWTGLLPALTPTMRGVLRNRRDLDAATERALASFGSIDLVLDGPAPAASGVDEVVSASAVAPAVVVAAPPVDGAFATESPGVSISDLVKRIDAYRRKRPATAAPAAAVAPTREFRFEAASDGVIFWLEGAPREAIVGQTLAQAAAADADHGVDGHVAGAFRRRSPFRDARLTVAGSGAAAGDWRISAVPLFTPLDGRFVGYRGSARRPRPDESASQGRSATELLGRGVAPDALRQVVHELRTPLNAIVGFAEMIEAQVMGPVGADYRAQAGLISDDGRRLLAAVEDLDMAARIEGERVVVAARPVNPGSVLAEVAARHAPRASGDPILDVRVAPAVEDYQGDAILFDRMLSRLVAAAIGLAGPSERIAVVLEQDGAGGLRFSVARPVRLVGRDERTLLDPGYAPDGDWPDAPLLGLGFSLRLVRNLAHVAGGRLSIEDGRFLLSLPRRVAEPEAGAR